MNAVTGQIVWAVQGPESAEQIAQIAQDRMVQEFGGEGRDFATDVDGDVDGVIVSFSFESSLDKRTLDARLCDFGVVAGGQYGEIEIELMGWQIA